LPRGEIIARSFGAFGKSARSLSSVGLFIGDSLGIFQEKEKRKERREGLIRECRFV